MLQTWTIPGEAVTANKGAAVAKQSRPTRQGLWPYGKTKFDMTWHCRFFRSGPFLEGQVEVMRERCKKARFEASWHRVF